MHQKGFSSIFMVLLLILLMIGGFLLYQKWNISKPAPTSTQPTQTASETTANWKTYISSKLGYMNNHLPFELD